MRVYDATGNGPGRRCWPPAGTVIVAKKRKKRWFKTRVDEQADVGISPG